MADFSHLCCCIASCVDMNPPVLWTLQKYRIWTNCFRFLWNGLRSLDRRLYAGSLVWGLEVTLVIIVWELRLQNRWGGDDEFGAYYYYYYYSSTTDRTAIIIIIVVFDLNIPDRMIMIYLEINGPITVLKCCGSEKDQVKTYVKCVA